MCFVLTAEDCLTLSAAISSDDAPVSVSLPSRPDAAALDIFTSANGCRRIDVRVPVESAPARAHPWMKLMEQNTSKSSAAAARARAGAKIVHILPVDEHGSHSRGAGWGMVEDGVLTKNSTAAIDQASFKAYKAVQRKRQRSQGAGQRSPKRAKTGAGATAAVAAEIAISHSSPSPFKLNGSQEGAEKQIVELGSLREHVSAESNFDVTYTNGEVHEVHESKMRTLQFRRVYSAVRRTES